jgi:hypothetical protein
LIARCIYNSGRDLGPPVAGIFYTAETAYSVRPGANYRVWGLGAVGEAMDALIWDDTGLPNWLPIGLFEIATQRIPADWEFCLDLASKPAQRRWAIWGYPQLVRDSAHRAGLAERTPESLECFFTQLARHAAGAALSDGFLSGVAGGAVQFSEFLEEFGAQLDRSADDPSLIRPAAKAIQLLVDRGDLIVGDVKTQNNGSLAVSPWSLSPADIYRYIRRAWTELDEPKHVNAICWLELREPS